MLKKQRLFNRYPERAFEPDLPNRPDQTSSFNPGNSGNPDTKEAFPLFGSGHCWALRGLSGLCLNIIARPGSVCVMKIGCLQSISKLMET
jgi:hypothetical protein